jgi:hypothetical protein
VAAGWGVGDGGDAGGLRWGAPEASGRSARARVQTLTECTAPAPSGNGAARLGRAIGYGTVGVFLGALQGASDGANWVWGTGGSRSDAVWIGAAAGAGVGFLVGFVAGLTKAGPGWSHEPVTSLSCPQTLAETTAPGGTTEAGLLR